MAAEWDTSFVTTFTNQVNTIVDAQGVGTCLKVAREHQHAPREVVYAVESCVQVDCEYQKHVWTLIDQIVTVLGDVYVEVWTITAPPPPPQCGFSFRSCR